MAKEKMSVAKATEKIIDAGLSVYEHENNCDTDSGTRHLTILGGIRRVSFYPSTLTTFAPPCKGFNPIKSSGIEAAIRVAKFGK